MTKTQLIEVQPAYPNLKFTESRAIVEVERFIPERSKTMMDWDLMVEYIQRAMDALDKAHEATNELRENVTPETLDEFRSQMDELIEHLTQLQSVLDHQEAFALDEAADWLSQAFSGIPADYRRTPRMKI